MSAETDSKTEEREAAAKLKDDFDTFQAQHGSWAAIQLALRLLIGAQRAGGDITKADYQGDNFRVKVTLK